MSALLFIAILYKKNRIEIFLMANALCLMAREEGLFIAGFLIALGGLRARGSKESGFYFFFGGELVFTTDCYLDLLQMGPVPLEHLRGNSWIADYL